MAVLLLETAVRLKAGSFAKDRWWYQAENPIQNLVLHMPDPLHWGCGGTQYCGARSDTALVKSKVSAWASVLNPTAEPAAAQPVGQGLRDHSNHQGIHTALPSSGQGRTQLKEL